jgi:hypothetical protein
LLSPELSARHRLADAAFTRERELPLPRLVSFLLNLRKGANQDELDRFSRGAAGAALGGEREPIGAHAGTCKARRERLGRAPPAGGRGGGQPMRRWLGFRLLAVDGSTFLRPHIPASVEAFGQTGEVTAQARFSRLYDVLNHVVLAADIEPLRTGERALAGEYLPMSTADDLLLYDRGYPAFWLVAAQVIEQREFCARVPRTFCAEVEQLAAGTARSAVVTLHLGEKTRRHCRMNGLPSEPLRLIRVALNSGGEELLVTSLSDAQRFPTALFKRLSHLRWGIRTKPF